jgi:hypothetical protein
MSTTNKQELAYCFSFSVGSAFGLQWPNSDGTGPQAMQDFVTTVATKFLADSTIQAVIGTDWVPVWGPVVQPGYSGDAANLTVHADATMGCYYSPSNNLFTIAIAGTNIDSPFDAMLDFDVSTIQLWSGIDQSGTSTSKGNIAAGTYQGVQTLFGMTDNTGVKLLSALKAFIGAKNVKAATIAVAGHSLGGALSPCVALYLFNNLPTLGLSGQTITAYPTAGPTPGDSDFASNFGSWCVSLYNTLDVVPLAWAQGDLATIPTLYGTNIPISDKPPNEVIGLIASGLQLNALAAKRLGIIPYNPFTALTRSAMAGTFNPNAASTLPHPELWKFPLSAEWNIALPQTQLQQYESALVSMVLFAAQAVYQHTEVYAALIDTAIGSGQEIETVVAEFKNIVAANKPTTALVVDSARHAVKRVTGVDLARINLEGIENAAAASQGAD